MQEKKIFVINYHRNHFTIVPYRRKGTNYYNYYARVKKIISYNYHVRVKKQVVIVQFESERTAILLCKSGEIICYTYDAKMKKLL